MYAYSSEREHVCIFDGLIGDCVCIHVFKLEKVYVFVYHMFQSE